MLFEEVHKAYLFPRIPLNLALPEDYPDIGCISNISVAPEIQSFRRGRDEFELKGTYQISVSYIKAGTHSDRPGEEAVPVCPDFFGQLRLQADGLLADGEDPEPRDSGGELYTVTFTRVFHTYLDLDFARRSRPGRPLMAVERVHLEPAEGRHIRGELVLGLVF